MIDDRFAKAQRDGGSCVAAVVLQMEEEPFGKGSARAEFIVFDPIGPVRITWNAIASLWAFSQGAGRLSRRMFDGKRSGKERLALDDDSELRRGLDSFELAHRFCWKDIDIQAAALEHWPKWAPDINPSPAVNSDDEFGNRFFIGALDWILRHELAHVAQRHAERQKSEGLSNQACETEADLVATQWLRGSRQAEESRPAGSKPSNQELELEWRAISIGLGLIWVAFFEVDRLSRNDTHPPVAERLFACLNALELREDSFAAEIIFDIIQAWIAPMEEWAPIGGYLTTRDAIHDAILRLHRFLS